MTTPAAAPAAASAPASSSAPSTTPASSAHSAASTSTPAPSAPASTGGGDPGANGVAQTPAGEPSKAAGGAAAAAEAARKLKLKINGQEREMDEAEVIRHAQLAAGADAKFREAAQLRQQSEQFLQQLIADPMSVLLHPDLADKINFRQLSENYLAKELQRELMSPEQRELAELRDWKQKQEAEAQETQQRTQTQAQQQAQAEAQQRAAVKYDTEMTEALKKSDLPKTPMTVKRVAEQLRDAMLNGYELDIQTAVDRVRDGYMADLSAMVGGLDGEALIKTFGPDLLKKIRKYDLAQIKSKLAPTEQAAPVSNSPTAAKQSDGSKALSPDEWREMIRKRAGV